ncbi:MAG TPA: DNA replication/repair protein RecF [Sphingomicrobium sp.]|nr:DNA replication/repair protein RecF [Sphingomicrobium sp.]
MPVTRLTLTDFRSYAAASLELGGGFVLLFGENGAGKTNLLEAVSMLAPGRGLRGAALSQMARQGGSGGWAAASKLDTAEIGTGTIAAAPERRQVRINGASASVNSLSEWLSVLWLTPAMDRLFTGSAGERRRFLDRLVLALEPAHAHHSTRYDAAMRARNKLLADERWDEAWLSSLEAAMVEHGTAIAEARARTVVALDERLAQAPEDEFARAEIGLEGWEDADLFALLGTNRQRDAAAGRATEGPHRQDLAVLHRAKHMPAAHSSTGEQKALLLGLTLAHAELVAERRGEAPIILLDEVAAHLDPKRRAALFARLEGRGQVWMTATEAALFSGISTASRFQVEPGRANSA